MGAEGTSVTAGLESWAAGGTEQVGLFISSTGRLSPLGSGCNILKKKKRKEKTGQHANALPSKCRYKGLGCLRASVQHRIIDIQPKEIFYYTELPWLVIAYPVSAEILVFHIH